jgi:hypothetical protein
MDKQEPQKSKKLSLKRETVRLLARPEGASPEHQPLTTPRCTDSGPKCDF